MLSVRICQTRFLYMNMEIYKLYFNVVLIQVLLDEVEPSLVRELDQYKLTMFSVLELKPDCKTATCFELTTALILRMLVLHALVGN